MIRHHDAASQLFVVEQYDASGSPGRQLPHRTPTDVLVVCAVRVAADDVVLTLVEGADEQTTRAALTAVGWHVDRIIPATWIDPDEEGTT